MADTSQTSASALTNVRKLFRALREDLQTQLQSQPRPKSLAEALRGKRVVVTGASSGIGKAVALKVAACGGTPLLVARSADKLEDAKRQIQAQGGQAFVYSADLSVPQDCERLISELLRDGPVDVLVNNAGRSIRRSVRNSYERAHDFERTMAINYFGALRMILGLLPQMRTRKSGHIINVSSAGVLVRTPRFAAYLASKVALDMFSQITAAECYGDRVYFTTVYMPLVRTPMIAPTRVYRYAPALSPEQAADLVLSPLCSHTTRVVSWMGVFMTLSHWFNPDTTLRVLGTLYRLTPGDAGGKRGSTKAAAHAAPQPSA